MKMVLLTAMIVLALLSFVSLYRAIIGPSSADRIVAINVLATKVTMLIVLLALYNNQEAFIDVALVYAMIGFIMTVGVSKYLEKRKLY